MQASLIKSPLSSTTFSYRVAPAPAPGLTAFREVTCMAKKKGIRLIVTLECTEARKENSVPSRYCTQKVGLAMHDLSH
ncbi:plastid ribosomal protein L33 [Haematococcus lacustris]|uniref:Plastid ribosomal protein L33 n=1 Tax=Haematococcus lacustris TaxID=44745 RepID=A0A699Z7P6_HAELA|nr:plastid ribosomal protein L33 [Haematococcus lacustris]